MTSNARHAVEMLDTMLRFSKIPHAVETQGEEIRIAYPHEILGSGRVYTVAQIGDSDSELVVLWDDAKLWEQRGTIKHTKMTVLQAYAKILYYHLKKEKTI